jgi:hypothetical protein
VAGIAEREEIEETIESHTLGSVVHEALSEFYGPFMGRAPSPDDLEVSENDAEKYIRKAFEKHYPGGQVERGVNLLLLRLAVVWFREFIGHERELLSSEPAFRFTIIGLEQRYERDDVISFGDDQIPYRLKGFIDRLDRTSDGHIRIIDYKTGTVEESKLNKVGIEDLFSDPAYRQAFQLMVYTILCMGVFNGEEERLQPGIFAFKRLSKGFLPLNPEGGITPADYARTFEERLERLIAEIFDPEVPFSQTEDLDRCKYCEFRDICNR